VSVHDQVDPGAGAAYSWETCHVSQSTARRFPCSDVECHSQVRGIAFGDHGLGDLSLVGAVAPPTVSVIDILLVAEPVDATVRAGVVRLEGCLEVEQLMALLSHCSTGQRDASPQKCCTRNVHRVLTLAEPFWIGRNSSEYR